LKICSMVRLVGFVIASSELFPDKSYAYATNQDKILNFGSANNMNWKKLLGFGWCLCTVLFAPISQAQTNHTSVTDYPPKLVSRLKKLAGPAI
jgi:hypothetical protein